MSELNSAGNVQVVPTSTPGIVHKQVANSHSTLLSLSVLSKRRIFASTTGNLAAGTGRPGLVTNFQKICIPPNSIKLSHLRAFSF